MLPLCATIGHLGARSAADSRPDWLARLICKQIQCADRFARGVALALIGYALFF